MFNEVPKGRRQGDGTELTMYPDRKNKHAVLRAPETLCFINASSKIGTKGYFVVVVFFSVVGTNTFLKNACCDFFYFWHQVVRRVSHIKKKKNSLQIAVCETRKLET